MSKGWFRRSVLASAVIPFAWLAVVGTAQAAYENVPTPTVEGPLPVTKTNYPFLATDINLKKYGYVEEEFLYTGMAFQYTWPQNSAADRTGTRVEDGGYPFKTRMIVRRPARAEDFNGVVVAEWMNVTARYDLEANWFGDPYYLLKNGYAFVGISAQHQGVSVLCCDATPLWDNIEPFNRNRYQGLDVNGGGKFSGNEVDNLSYDIFSSGVKAVRGEGQGSNPLGSLARPETVVASGESQSCGRLGNHYNRVEPLHDVVDAYLLTVCGAPKLRGDESDKAIRILSETETSSGPVDDPSTASFRKWEVAGGSHLPRLAFDNWNFVVSRDRVSQKVSCKEYPLSLVQWPFTQNRAISDLVSWSKGGKSPAKGIPMRYQDGALVRDKVGHAKGGIRYPEIEVPTGVNKGTNTPDAGPTAAFCFLLGSYEAFKVKEVQRLHGNLSTFVRKSGKVADRLVSQGFLLKQDASRLRAIAREYPLLRPGAPKAKVVRKGGRTSVKLSWFGTTSPRTTFDVVRAKAGKGKPKWRLVKAKVKGQKVTLAGQSRGSWVYGVRSKSRVEIRNPKTNTSTYPLRTTPYSDASKPVRIR